MGSGIELARKVAEKLHVKPRVQVFKNFGTAMVAHEDLELELSVPAKNLTEHPENLLLKMVSEDDQNRRDFTINTLALCLNQDRSELIILWRDESLRRWIIEVPVSPM